MENKSLHPGLLAAIGVFLAATLASIIYFIVELFFITFQPQVLVNILVLVICAGLAVFYLIYGYKLKNNDILKFVFAAFGVGLILMVSIASNNYTNDYRPWVILCVCLSGALALYMCGRLKKWEDGIICSALVTALLILTAVLNFNVFKDVPPTEKSLPSLFAPLTSVMILSSANVALWLLIVLSYLARYSAFRAIKKADK